MTRVPRSNQVQAADLLLVGPFHDALRAAIRERGLTLDRLRTRIVQRGIPVALSTLSDWQLGHRQPGTQRSLLVVEVLEELLCLPPTSLRRLLAHDTRGLDERGGALGELLDCFPGSRDRDLSVVVRQQKVVLDAHGFHRRTWHRTLIRARRDGVDRYVVRFIGDPGSDIDSVALHPLENCRLGRVQRHPSQPVMVGECLLGTALAMDETWVFEYETVSRTGQLCTDHGHGFRHGVSQYLLEVRFHAARLPAVCYSYARHALDGELHRTGVLTPNAHHAVHMSASDVTSGVLGIAWQWPPETVGRAPQLPPGPYDQ